MKALEGCQAAHGLPCALVAVDREMQTAADAGWPTRDMARVHYAGTFDRERIPVPWRDLVRVYRLEELRGEVRGGRFVQRFAGEQYALPEAIELMRRLRRRAGGAQAHAEGHAADQAARLHVAAADPLNLEGILTPEPRVPLQARRRVPVG